MSKHTLEIEMEKLEKLEEEITRKEADAITLLDKVIIKRDELSRLKHEKWLKEPFHMFSSRNEMFYAIFGFLAIILLFSIIVALNMMPSPQPMVWKKAYRFLKCAFFHTIGMEVYANI